MKVATQPVSEFNTEYARKRQVEAEIALQQAIDAGMSMAKDIGALQAYIEHMGLTTEFDEWASNVGGSSLG